MTLRSRIQRLLDQEQLNFILTNRIPRHALTQFMGWFSRIEHPLVRDISMSVWRFFGDLDLTEAKKSEFRSLHDCFIRELKEGVRPIDGDPEILVSPCDAIVGMSGSVDGTQLYQVKGLSYSLQELVCDAGMVDLYRNGRYVTLRLTAGMYHRFHAPHDCKVEQVTYISGDSWNVNPAALRRIEKLFCKNERAVLRTRLTATNHMVTLVPVAAVLVAGIRLRFLGALPCRTYYQRTVIDCDAQFGKGEEVGWFEHGSTIIVFAPSSFTLCDSVQEGACIRMGQPLMHLPRPSIASSLAGHTG
jgi:phosphatidylserine decarboxylase